MLNQSIFSFEAVFAPNNTVAGYAIMITQQYIALVVDGGSILTDVNLEKRGDRDTEAPSGMLGRYSYECSSGVLGKFDA